MCASDSLVTRNIWFVKCGACMGYVVVAVVQGSLQEVLLEFHNKGSASLNFCQTLFNKSL